jgi:hypothetical protein
MTEVLDKGTWEGEFTVRRRDGTSFPAHVVNTLIRDEEGGDRPTGFVGVSVDVS